MKMSISRALKERKRIIGEMNTIQRRISMNNAVVLTVKTDENGNFSPPSKETISNKRKADPEDLLTKWYALRERLVSLKMAMHSANVGIIEKLIRLSELKAELGVWESFSMNDNETSQYGDRTVRVVDVVFDSKWVLSKVDGLRKEINDLQDEVDEYNATHYIEVGQ